jgi:thymidine kinase
MLDNEKFLSRNIIEIGLSPEIKWPGKGEQIVIVGPALSGKTEKLAYLLDKVRFPKNKGYLLFSVNNEGKYGRTKIRPFNGSPKQELDAIAVFKPEQIVQSINKLPICKRVIGIDNVHLFREEFDATLLEKEEPKKIGLGVVDLCNALFQRGFRVIVTGTDLNWQGFPQRNVLDIVAFSTEVHKLDAICDCGQKAFRSQLIINNNKESFKPVCFEHWNPNFPNIENSIG